MNAEFRPFKYPLFESGFYSEYENSEIKRIKHLPHKLVRITIGVYETLPQEELYGHIQSTQYEHIENKKVLERLQNQFNILVPDFDIVIGPRDGEQVNYYTIVDRIYGENLEYHDVKPKEVKKVGKLVEALYSSMIIYFQDVYQNGGWFLSDLSRDNSQFFYGRKKGGKEKSIYFVDIEPRLEYIDENRPLTHEGLLVYTFNWLYESMCEIEYRLGFRLTSAREGLLSFARTIPPTYVNYPLVSSTINELTKSSE